MKMPTAFIWCLVALTGCRAPVIQGKSIFLSSSEKTDIGTVCSELAGIGNIKELREQFHRDVLTLKELAADGSERALQMIPTTAERVRITGENIKALVDPKFTSIDRPQRLAWDLSFPEMGFGAGAEKYWTISHVVIEKIFTWKGEDPELAEFLKLDITRNGVDAIFERPASPLEVCQLQESILFLVKVELDHAGRKRNFYFKLLAKNEVLDD